MSPKPPHPSTETAENPTQAQTGLVVASLSLLPLPGSLGWQPQHGSSLSAIMDRAEQECYALTSAGVDTILLTNDWDMAAPNTATVAPMVAAFTHVAQQLRKQTQTPLGISVLPNAPATALAIAIATGCQFIHAPVLVGQQPTATTLLTGQLHALTAAYQQLGTQPSHIPVWASVAPAPGQTMQHAVDTLHHEVTHHGAATGTQLVIDKLLLHQTDSIHPDGTLALPHSDTPLVITPSQPTQSTLAALQPCITNGTGVLLGSAFRRTPLHASDTRPAMDAFLVEQWAHELKTGKTIHQATADAGNEAIKALKAQEAAQHNKTTPTPEGDTTEPPPSKCPFSKLGLPGFGKKP